MLVLAGQDVEQRSPQVGIAAEPVQGLTVEQLAVEQTRRGAVQAVLAIIAIAESVWLVQRAVPRVPGAAVGQFDVQIDGDLADVVQQRGIGDCGSPGFRLRRLVFGTGANGQQMGLPQFQAVGDDFETVVEHAARVGMVMRLGGRECLDQLGIAFQGRAVQGGELPA